MLICYYLVVYDDDLTDALFDVFTRVFQDKSRLHSVYITIEKRINFYHETLSVQCPAYEYFLEKLNQLKIKLPILTIEEMNTDLQSIKQCTSIYQRTKELVNILIDIFDAHAFLVGSMAYLSFTKISIINAMHFINNIHIGEINAWVSMTSDTLS